MLSRKSISLITIIALLCLSSWSSNWFEVYGEGAYTDGMEREPTIKLNYIIDNSQEQISISIENATPLLSYWSQREDINVESSLNNESIGQDISTNSRSEKCQGSCLDNLREVLPIFYILFLLFVIYYEINKSRNLKFVISFTWIITIFILLFIVPFAFANDFGINSENNSSTGGFDTDTKETVELNQFAHFTDNSDFGISFSGMSFEYHSSGFDLGLLDEVDRQSVIDDEPNEGEIGYESLVVFEGVINIALGNSVLWLFCAGIIILFNWIKFPVIDKEYS